jgi:hypothetical protein
MAFFSDDTAVVSLGVSCQTAMQLEAHEPWIREWLGGGETHKTPLDWLLSPTRSTAQMIDEWAFLPPVDEAVRDPALRWPRVPALYIHDHDWRDDPAITHAKYAHKAGWLAKVAEKRRRVFIVSNTQNNLAAPVWAANLGDDWFRLDDAGLDALRTALEARFGAVELYAVSYPYRHAVTSSADRLFELEPDLSSVEGDKDQWARVLAAIL